MRMVLVHIFPAQFIDSFAPSLKEASSETYLEVMIYQIPKYQFSQVDF